jgi:hypothetical protein
MNTLVNLLKDHKIGIWCKRAAWIILAIGLIQIVSDVYIETQLYSVGFPNLNNLTVTQRWQIFSFSLARIPSLLFYFFLLYAAGAIVNSLVGSQNAPQEADEDEADELEDEEITPGQMP